MIETPRMLSSQDRRFRIQERFEADILWSPVDVVMIKTKSGDLLTAKVGYADQRDTDEYNDRLQCLIDMAKANNKVVDKFKVGTISARHANMFFSSDQVFPVPAVVGMNYQ